MGERVITNEAAEFIDSRGGVNSWGSIINHTHKKWKLQPRNTGRIDDNFV